MLSNSTKIAEQIHVMNDLSDRLSDTNPVQSLKYAKQALKLSQQTKNRKQEVKALYNIGVSIYDSLDKRDSSLVYFTEGERLAKEYKLDTLRSDHLMKLANYFRYRKVDSSKTVQYLLQSVEISKTANYHYGTGRSYAKLASFYTRHKKIQLCEEYLRLSAEYYLKIENGLEETAHYYDEVANKIWDYYPKKSMDLYFEGLKYSNSYPNLKVSLAKAYLAIDKPDMAFKYLNEALTLLKTNKYPRVKGIATAKLAEVYLQRQDYEAALTACDDGIALLKPVILTNKSALPALYRIKGTLMELQNNEKEAIALYNKSIEESNKINEPFDLVKSTLSLGNFYITKDPNKAQAYCEFALKKAKKDNFSSLGIDACECLYTLNKTNKSYEKALSYFEQKSQLIDSLSTIQVVHALDINDQLAKKDKKIAEESYLKEIKDEQLKNQFRINQILIISSFLGLLLIALLSLGLKRIRKQNVEITKKTTALTNANDDLARSNEELERFAHVASHDLKSPLNTIISFTGLLRKKLDVDAGDSIKDYISYIENSGTRMRKLIDDILQYSKLSSQEDNEKEIVSLNKIVEEISLLVNENANGKKVNIEASNLPNIKWNHSKIFLLLKNFIENGLKYNESENPQINVHFTKSSEKNVIHIEDNGIGIKEEYFDKIFIMFQRLHGQDKYDGTGLGLATCKKIVDEFKGNIEVDSKENKGTIFKIEIPDHLIIN